LQRVIPKEHLPVDLTAKFLATAAVKWIVLGGGTLGGGTLGGGTLGGGTLGGGTLGGLAGEL
jgi:hypothetical protein